jgi:hypothetical protein
MNSENDIDSYFKLAKINIWPVVFIFYLVTTPEIEEKAKRTSSMNFDTFGSKNLYWTEYYLDLKIKILIYSYFSFLKVFSFKTVIKCHIRRGGVKKVPKTVLFNLNEPKMCKRGQVGYFN